MKLRRAAAALAAAALAVDRAAGDARVVRGAVVALRAVRVGAAARLAGVVGRAVVAGVAAVGEAALIGVGGARIGGRATGVIAARGGQDEEAKRGDEFHARPTEQASSQRKRVDPRGVERLRQPQ